MDTSHDAHGDADGDADGDAEIEVDVEGRIDADAGAGIGAAGVPPGARVLVVDDSRVARELLAALCRAQGLAPEMAAGGRAALRMARAAALAGRPFDWVLLDWRMPEMSGLSAAALLLDEFAQPPRIALVTAFSNDETLYEAMSRLPTGQRPPVLAKPVTAAMLRGVLGAAPPCGGPGSAQARRQAATRAAMRGLAGARLLVVDDIAVNRDLAEELLSRAGISVTLAGNGAIALALLRASPDAFDGVLMDCQMPEMDGYEATRQLREDPRWRALPVIALTANATGADRTRILATGMNDHIAKPLHADALFDTLARWVRPRAADRPDRAQGPEAGGGVPLSAEAPSPVPAIEGLESRTGLATAANNTTLYLRLLRVFHQTQQATAAQLDAAGEDPQALERIAHALRGASATIGAMTLCEAAAALEQACRAGAPAPRRRALAAETRAALDRLLGGLDRTLDALPASPAPSLPPGVPMPGTAPAPAPEEALARLMTDLARWRRQLAGNDGAAAETAEALAQTLDRVTGQIGPERAARLREAAQAAARFDFEAALRLLDAATPPSDDEQAAARASR
jgi:CheY-like chemotaxis protein